MDIKVIKGYKELKDVLEKESIVLAGIGPEECGECKECMSKIREILDKHKNKKFVFVRCILDEEISEKYNLTSPTLIIFKNKKEIVRLLPEKIGKEKMLKEIDKFLEESVD